jgi:uncharacterized membrane protein YkoI
MKNANYFLIGAGTLLFAMSAEVLTGADLNDIKLLTEAKITLSQAIHQAEKSQDGQAIEASLDDDSFKPAYEVSVVRDGKIFDVQVDALSGEVLGAREDVDD